MGLRGGWNWPRTAMGDACRWPHMLNSTTRVCLAKTPTIGLAMPSRLGHTTSRSLQCWHGYRPTSRSLTGFRMRNRCKTSVWLLHGLRATYCKSSASPFRKPAVALERQHTTASWHLSEVVHVVRAIPFEIVQTNQCVP